MKIADLNVGDNVVIPLVVTSATPRETRAKKPYLSLELFDGTTSINGNYWDWISGNVPATNTILDVTCRVAEWQGTKQLNITKLNTNPTLCLNDFMPSSNYNIEAIYKASYSLASEVKDDALRTIALGLLEDLCDLWLTVPAAKGVHHNYVGGTLVHSYHVAVLAKAIAEQIPEASVDLCVVGGLLHDVGKLYGYSIDGVTIDMTIVGMLYEHLFIGAELIGNFAEKHIDTDANSAQLLLLRHIILSHHGELEYGSPVTPACIEAYIVHHADKVDATYEQIRTAQLNSGDNCWTDRIYTLHNRPHLNSAKILE